MAVSQAKRLSYTRRDLISYHEDVSRYIKAYITRITDTSEMNTGRLYLTVYESLTDNANYAIDQSFLEWRLDTARQRKNILRAAYDMQYDPSAVSPASVDLTWTMVSGTAPVGGQAIPVYSRVQTTSSPTMEFFTTEAGIIPEGGASTSIPAIQGVRISGESLAAAASGDPDQRYTLANARTPHDLVEVYVDGVLWERVLDFTDSGEESQHYILRFDEDDYTSVIFGDNEFGKAPGTGSVITATYVRTEADLGNAGTGAVARVVGALASTVSVTNPYRASGGATSETNTAIKRNAPAYNRSFERAVTKKDYTAHADAIPGVYKSFAVSSEGARSDIYLLPEGGGVASSYLIDLVQTELDSYKVEGTIPVVDTLQPTGIVISVNVITKTSNIKKSTVRLKIKEATEDNLEYTQLIRGRGFTTSDLAGIYENIDDGDLVDYVDFVVLTRVPRIQKSNVAAPDFVGRVKIGSTAGYDDYLVTATTTTTFTVAKNSAPQVTQGTVATEYTTSGSEITFTLGEAGDTFTIGDTWRFKTSEYVDNIVIDNNEVMELEKSSDLTVSVFYPGEYNIATKAAV
jgi:hypothetical protein